MKKNDVFISYSRKDLAYAEKVCAVFDEYKQHYKFEYFFDCEDIKSKHDFLERISEAISESRVMLFLASENSTASEFCLKELLFADEEHVQIHQYRLDDTAYPKSIRLLLGNHHYRVAKEFSIENMVREVLENALKCEIKKIEDLRHQQIRTFAPYKLGDYYNDGIKEGVVFYVDEAGNHGKIVSLIECNTRLQWAVDRQEYTRYIGACNEFDGAENFAIIKTIPNWKDKYPSFAWCASLGDEWYLPAKEELRTIFNHKDILDPKLIDKLVLFFYWSSTESRTQSQGVYSAWHIGMYRGLARICNKNSEVNYVRAVAQF